MAERKRPTADAAAEGTPSSFEEALERLETIVDELEGGQLSLEVSIARYEEGIKLSRHLGAKLDEAEKRIDRLVEAGHSRVATEPMELDERNAPAEPEGRLPL
jgi:exodeoxyribonuclease VII small subunit